MNRAPINLDLIRSRSADIRAEMAELTRYASLDEAAFLGNPAFVRAARYSLVVAVEAAAAICNHLAARSGRVPDSYPGCFELLPELGVLDSELAGRLTALARLRNLLVHGYRKIEDARIHQLLQSNLSDLDAYLRAVDGYLSRRGDGS